MRLHLPPPLLRSILGILTMLGVSYTLPAHGGVMFDCVPISVYTDYGQNCGRYVAGQVNDMLSTIRANDGGVVIPYVGAKFEATGKTQYTLDSMIDFSSGGSTAVDAAVGYGFLGSVTHAGTHNPNYAAPLVGSGNAVQYTGIEYWQSNNGGYLNTTELGDRNLDLKLTRLSKLVTDVRTSDAFSTTGSPQELEGKMIYRAGSGEMVMFHVKDNGMPDPEKGYPLPTICSYYVYVSGGVQAIDYIRIDERPDGSFAVKSEAMKKVGQYWDGMQNAYDYVTGSNVYGFEHPMPGLCLSGDSGSPSWIWDEASQTYKYFGAMASGESSAGAIIGSGTDWMPTILEKYNVNAMLGQGGHEVTFLAVDGDGGEFSGLDNNGNTLTVHKKMGSLTYTDISGQAATTDFCGVQSGVNTWNNLANRKNLDNWFNYDGSYLNSGRNVSEASGKIDQGELLQTNNIVLTAADSATYSLKLNATVDTGIGYLRLSKAEGVETARFQLSSNGQDDNGQDYQLNTAGFVVDRGVTLDIALTADATYMREWRKVGAGDLVISGSGNNNVLLNIGGNSEGANDGDWTSAHREGKVILNRQNGYAAYNVLASTGSTVVLEGGIDQVKRNITLGAGGAVLDLHGNDYEWNNSDDSHFSLYMMAEGDTLANYSGSATVTVKDTHSGLSGISQNFIGAFEDSSGGELDVIYDGGSTWTMNTVFTDLSHNGGSSFAVKSGEVVLQGTLTQHAKGSESGRNGNRLVRDNDWHYAHAKMDVEVRENAKFTLGSHAFLEGDVQVVAGGIFELHQAVNHAQEYVEGGTMLEDVAIYSDHYGLSKDSTVSNEGTLHVKYEAGTDADTTFKGKLTGSGAVVFEMGTDGGTFTLANAANDFFGSKRIESGGLIATSRGALGDVTTNKYEIGAKGFLAVEGTTWTTDMVQTYVASSSEGVLALTQDQADAISTADIPGLIIGAVDAVTYGTKDAALTAIDGKWRLGGGGGTLTVDFLLNNTDADLELGNAYTKGTVILTNTDNRIGNIIMYGGVTLKGDPAALGGAKLEIPYGSRLSESSIAENTALSTNSQGVLLVDSGTGQTLDLTQHSQLAIGSDDNIVLNRAITTANNAAYRFGGITGTLTVNSELTGNHDLVVDNQTYSGGTLLLNSTAGLTGKVQVMGYDENRTDEQAGDIRVQLGQNGMLNSTQQTTVRNGGVLDLNGTNQTLRTLSIGATGALMDSRGNGTLLLSGENSVEGALSIGSLAVDNATVRVGEQAVWEVGNLTLENHAAVTVEEQAYWKVSNLTLADSSLQLGNSALTGSLQVTGGASTVQTKGTASLSTLQTAAGSVLELTADTLTLNGIDYSSDAAGTVILKANRLNLNNGDGTSIGGTLELTQDTTLYSDGSRENLTRTISNLSLADGITATLDSPSWNTIWDIRKLTGGGDLLWTANTNHSVPARLVLSGANESFTGKITVARTAGANKSRAWQTYMELGHENAAAHAEVTLNGQNDSSMVALALNAATIRLEGLSGNAYAAVYAGAAVTDPALINTAPQSTRNTTLVLAGDENYTYGGMIFGDGEHLISLDKSGSGTQTLDGKSVVLGDVAVSGGSLVLGVTEGRVHGDVSISNASVTFNSASLEVAGNISADHAAVNLQQALQSSAQNTLSFTGTGNTLSGQVNLKDVTVESGAGLTLTDAAVSTVISNSGTVHVGSGTVFNVTQADFAAALREHKALTLIEGHGGSVNAPTTTVMVGGTALADMLATGQSVSYGTEGGSLTASVARNDNNIIWTGAPNAIWDLKKSTNWKQQSDSVATTAAALSNVIFENQGARYVTVASEGVTAWNMTAVSGSYLFQTGAITVLNNLDLQGASYVQPTAKMTVLGDVSVAAGTTLAASAGLDAGGTIYLGGTLSIGTVNNDELKGDIRAERGSGTKGTLTRPKGAEGTLKLSGTVELAAFNAVNSTAANATLFIGETSVNTMQLTSGTAAVSGEGTLSIADKVTLDESSTRRGSLEGRDGEGKRQYAITAPAASTASVEHLNPDAAMVLRSNSITNAELKEAVLTIDAGTTLQLNDVKLASTSRIEGDAAVPSNMRVDNLLIEGVDGTNVETAASQTLDAGSSLTMFGTPTKSVTLQADAEAMIYVVNNVQDVALTGESLTINLSGLVQTPQPGQWIGITLGGDSHTSSMDTGLLVECIIGSGQKMQGYYLSSSTSGDSANRVLFQMEGVVSQDLIWDNSTSNANWSTSTSDTNWHTVDAPTNHLPFTPNANVTFESGTSTATLTETITAGTVTLASGANVTINGNGHNFTMGEMAGSEATLTITNSAVDKTTTVNGNAEIGALNVKGGTTVFAGGAADLGKIIMQNGNGETTLKFSAKAGALNEYTFDTLDMASSGGVKRWLEVDEGVKVTGTGHDLGNNNNSTIASGWGVNSGGLKINGELDLAGAISFDDANTSYIQGSGQINTTGLNISNGNKTTIQGGVKINITSGTGIYKRAGADCTLNLADATLQAKTVDWELKDSVDNVNLTNAADGTTFEAAYGRTITLTKQMGGSGKLVKAGEGTVLVKGANTYSGGTTVDAGTLVATNASALGSGPVTLNSGTLDLTTAVNTGAFTMNGGTLALDGANWITSTGDIKLNGGTLDLTGMSITSGRDYTLATGTGVTLDETVVFSLQDSSLESQYQLVSQNNSLMLTYISPVHSKDLIWDNHAGNGKWSTSAEDMNWHEEGAEPGSSGFAKDDSVTFPGNASTATLQEDIVASEMTLQSGANLTVDTNGHNLTTLKLNAEGGSSLTKQGTGTASFGAGDQLNLTQLTTSGGKTVFGGKVAVTGANSNDYWMKFNGDTELMDGLSFSGSGKNNYAFIVGNNAKVTLHGDTDVHDYLVGPAGGTTLELANGASLSVKGLYNSTNVGSNGNIVLGENATLTVGASGMYTPSLTLGAGSTASLGGKSQLQSVTGAGTLAVTGGTLQLNGNNGSFTGNVSVSNGTIELGSNTALGAGNASSERTITINDGGAIDLKGHYNTTYAFTLNGGTLKNTGGDTGTGHMQTAKLVLTDNSKVDGTGNFYVLNSGYNPATVTLNGHTLTKTGSNTVGFFSTTFNTAGTLEVLDGALMFNTDHLSTLAENVTIKLNDSEAGNEDKLTGKVNVNKTLTLDAQQTSNVSLATDLKNAAATLAASVEDGKTLTVSGVISGSGSVAKAGSGTLTLNTANTYSGGTDVNAGTLVAGNAGALGTGAVQIAQGGNLVINAAMSNHTANSFNNSGGILTMQDGSSLTMHVTGGTRTFNLGNVVVNGSAGIAANTSTACYNALFNMTSLSSGSNGAEIVLATGAQYSKATVFDLDTNQTAAFNGTITVKQNNTSASAGRPVALNLTIGEDAKAAEILKESVIKLDSAGNTNALVGLGLNSDVTVKGIDSGTAAAKQHAIFAGKATTDTATFASTGDDARTLTIDTAGTDHSTHADVLDKINLVKKGEGTQVFSGDMSQFNGSVDVEAGVLNIMNIAQATSLNVTDVTISNGTLGVYKGATATADTANEGTLTIKAGHTLTASGENAKLNANLVMDGGSTLDVSGTNGTGLLMGSSVTLNKGMTLADYSGSWSGWEDGHTYTLFTGVDGLDIGGGMMAGTLDYTQWVDAKEYFTNIEESNRYFLCYGGAPAQNAKGILTAVNDGSNVGMVYIMTMPEPTTSTLSLLALAALSARRRRK